MPFRNQKVECTPCLDTDLRYHCRARAVQLTILRYVPDQTQLSLHCSCQHPRLGIYEMSMQTARVRNNCVGHQTPYLELF